MNIFYDMLAPGGLLLATNVDASIPSSRCLITFLSWNLIYRTGAELRQCAGQRPPTRTEAGVYADPTSVNLYLQVRENPFS